MLYLRGDKLRKVCYIGFSSRKTTKDLNFLKKNKIFMSYPSLFHAVYCLTVGSNGSSPAQDINGPKMRTKPERGPVDDLNGLILRALCKACT